MHREKFPEKIPFRLTRMLTHAMEVSGIEGSFRNTCEISMKVLRENKESLMAVLEAFVYDPLINWRLMQPDVERRGEGSYPLRSIYRFLSSSRSSVSLLLLEVANRHPLSIPVSIPVCIRTIGTLRVHSIF